MRHDACIAAGLGVNMHALMHAPLGIAQRKSSRASYSMPHNGKVIASPSPLCALSEMDKYER